MMEKQNSYSHILKYTSLFGGVQVLSILVGLVRNKLVALILGPMGMGLLALFSSTIKLVGDSTNLGLSISAVRNMSGAYDSGDHEHLLRSISVFRHWSLLTSLFGMLVCIVLSPLLSSWTFSFGDHTLHFVLLAPVVALTTFSTGELAILKATRRLRDIAENSVYAMLVTLFVSVPIYYFFGYKGIVLTGTEIKSIRGGKASLVDCYCDFYQGELWVKGMNISPYFYGSFSNHEARRDRKLLLTKRELRRLEEDSKQPGFTIVPTLIFIDNHGRAKVDIALCKGKKEYDKRQTLKEKEDRREMDRAMKRY